MPIGKGAQSMERKYLSGNIRERLQDLMKERKIACRKNWNGCQHTQQIYQQCNRQTR